MTAPAPAPPSCAGAVLFDSNPDPSHRHAGSVLAKRDGGRLIRFRLRLPKLITANWPADCSRYCSQVAPRLYEAGRD